MRTRPHTHARRLLFCFVRLACTRACTPFLAPPQLTTRARLQCPSQGFEKGTALFGTVDTWLAWNLTGGASGVANGTTRHVTDVTNASRTMMMDLGACSWDVHTIGALGVGSAALALPEITSSADTLGVISDGGPFNGVPLTAMIGDQQSAMVGQRCFQVRPDTRLHTRTHARGYAHIATLRTLHTGW